MRDTAGKSLDLSCYPGSHFMIPLTNRHTL